MSDYVRPLRSRPAALVPVAVATWEEAWRRRGMSLSTLGLFSAIVTDEAERALADEPERDAADAMTIAWNTVAVTFGNVMEQRGYIAATVTCLRHQAHDALLALERETFHDREARAADLDHQGDHMAPARTDGPATGTGT